MLHTENGSLVKAHAYFLSLSRLLCLHQGGADSGGQTEAHLRITRKPATVRSGEVPFSYRVPLIPPLA